MILAEAIEALGVSQMVVEERNRGVLLGVNASQEYAGFVKESTPGDWDVAKEPPRLWKVYETEVDSPARMSEVSQRYTTHTQHMTAVSELTLKAQALGFTLIAPEGS